MQLEFNRKVCALITDNKLIPIPFARAHASVSSSLNAYGTRRTSFSRSHAKMDGESLRRWMLAHIGLPSATYRVERKVLLVR